MRDGRCGRYRRYTEYRSRPDQQLAELAGCAEPVLAIGSLEDQMVTQLLDLLFLRRKQFRIGR